MSSASRSCLNHILHEVVLQERNLPVFRKPLIGHDGGMFLLKLLTQRLQDFGIYSQKSHNLHIAIMVFLHSFQYFKLVFYHLFFFRFLFQILRLVAHVFCLPCLA